NLTKWARGMLWLSCEVPEEVLVLVWQAVPAEVLEHLGNVVLGGPWEEDRDPKLVLHPRIEETLSDEMALEHRPLPLSRLLFVVEACLVGRGADTDDELRVSDPGHHPLGEALAWSLFVQVNYSIDTVPSKLFGKAVAGAVVVLPLVRVADEGGR